MFIYIKDQAPSPGIVAKIMTKTGREAHLFFERDAEPEVQYACLYVSSARLTAPRCRGLCKSLAGEMTMYVYRKPPILASKGESSSRVTCL